MNGSSSDATTTGLVISDTIIETKILKLETKKASSSESKNFFIFF